MFSSVSQQWPTAEPWFQETGLHCPPDHRRRAVRALVAFAAEAAREFGFRTGVLHIEAKSTSAGPRIVEINARMAAGRCTSVEAGLGGRPDRGPGAQQPRPATVPAPIRHPRCAIVDSLVYAPASGRLATLPLAADGARHGAVLDLDVHAEVGEDVVGPDAIFATTGRGRRRGRGPQDARADLADVLRERRRIDPAE